MFAIQNILNINITFNNILYDSRITYEYNFPVQLKEITCKKLDVILTKQKLMENKIPEFKNYEKMNQKLCENVRQSFGIK